MGFYLKEHCNYEEFGIHFNINPYLNTEYEMLAIVQLLYAH